MLGDESAEVLAGGGGQRGHGNDLPSMRFPRSLCHGTVIPIRCGHCSSATTVVTEVLVLLLAGAAGAFMNTVAASGSAIVIPILLAIGVEPVMANASNRVLIVVGCATAVWRFHRAGHLPWNDACRFSIPTMFGAVCGALLASVFGDLRTTQLLTFAVAVTLVVLLLNPSRWLAADRPQEEPNRGPLALSLMALVGGWAGLIAVDSGTYALAVLVMVAHFPIREANGIKVAALGSAGLISLLIFTQQAVVAWRPALILAAGSVVGASLGARLALGPNAAKWVFRLLVLVLVSELVPLVIRFLGSLRA